MASRKSTAPREALTLEEAVKVLSQKFLMQEGIAGVSHRDRLIVYVESRDHLHKVPETLFGYGVEARVVGRIYTLARPASAPVGRALTGQLIDRMARVRPVPGGVSCGHPLVTAGTVGSRVYDARTGLRLALSNNHVIAASNRGRPGDPVLQPGPHDGGRAPGDVFAYLERFAVIRPPPDSNLIDAAVARPVSDEVLSDEVLDVGVVTSTAEATVGMKVAKSGRTTGYTEGTVQDVNAAVKVHNYPWGYSIFEDQLITSYMAWRGDSGSLLVDARTRSAVGLVFAGSTVITVANKISNVARLLEVDFSPPIVRPPLILSLAPLSVGALALAASTRPAVS